MRTVARKAYHSLPRVDVTGSWNTSSNRCQLAGLDPSSAEYDRVYRRYLRAESFLGVVVVLTVFAMAAKPFS